MHFVAPVMARGVVHGSATRVLRGHERVASFADIGFTSTCTRQSSRHLYPFFDITSLLGSNHFDLVRDTKKKELATQSKYGDCAAKD